MEKTRRAKKNQDLSKALGENVEENFEKLIRAFQDRLYSFSLRLTNNRADAEEIVQEGFFRAFRALKSYPSHRIEIIDLGPWLYRIILNVFRTRVRKARSPVFPLDGSHLGAGGTEEAAAEPGPDEVVEKAQILDRLEQAVVSLPDRYRVPLVLRYVENVAYSKIKDILKQPEGTVKSNVHRGIQLLRENFSKMKRRER
jgi:RNA polymerase sigma-70 factor (ECF subfamily)